ncbi:MAG: hypothetical protein V4714_15235 [Bacteroidota bacterium]
MKTTILFLSLLCLIAFANTYSTGMGYPQDMFAEHLTVKKVPAIRQTKDTTKKNVDQKTTTSPGQQRCNKPAQVTCPTQTEKKLSSNQEAKSAPIVSNFNSVNIITMKVFNLDGNEVEEQMISEDEWAEKSYINQPLHTLIEMLGNNIHSIFVK